MQHKLFLHRLVILILTVFILGFFIPSYFLRAGTPYPAVDEIGHTPLDFTKFNPNNDAPISANGFATPIGIAMDTMHHWLFVADADNNRILVFTLDSNNQPIDRTADFVLGQSNFEDSSGGGQVAMLNMNGVHYPDVLEYDTVHSRLFVSDGLNSRVLVFDFSNGVITNGQTAAYALGSFVPELPSQNSLNAPNGLAYDEHNDRLYVADTLHSRVLVFDVRPNGSSPQTLCGYTSTGIENSMNASCVLGAPDFATVNDGSLMDASRLYYPIGLFFDKNTDLLYATNDTFSIRIFDTTTLSNGQAAVHVLGWSDFTTLHHDPTTGVSANTSPSRSTLDDPRGMMMDTENAILYVSDTNHHRVVGYDVSSITDGEDAISVIGTSDFTSTTSGQSGGQTSFNLPQWSVWDPLNRIQYIVDALNNRVMLFKMIQIDPASFIYGTVGTPYTSGAISVHNQQGTVSFELVSGALPPGISLDATGLIGTPTLSGIYNFTLRATDRVGEGNTFFSNHQSYSMDVGQTDDDDGGGSGGDTTPALKAATGGSVVFPCHNDLDDDHDGLTDQADPDCHSDGNAANSSSYSGGLSEITIVALNKCSDGIDNDGDGKVDYPADPGCSSRDDDDEVDQVLCTDPAALNYCHVGACIYPPTNTKVIVPATVTTSTQAPLTKNESSSPPAPTVPVTIPATVSGSEEPVVAPPVKGLACDKAIEETIPNTTESVISKLKFIATDISLWSALSIALSILVQKILSIPLVLKKFGLTPRRLRKIRYNSGLRIAMASIFAIGLLATMTLLVIDSTFSIICLFVFYLTFFSAYYLQYLQKK